LGVGDETVQTCEERRYLMRCEEVHYSSVTWPKKGPRQQPRLLDSRLRAYSATVN
jgi:hypothetical protein